MVCGGPDLNDLIEATLLRNKWNVFYSGLTWGNGFVFNLGQFFRYLVCFNF